jgi:hypothetical protein
MPSFFGTPVDQLSESNFSWLVANQVRENDRLDYKVQMYGRSDNDKRELLRALLFAS